MCRNTCLQIKGICIRLCVHFIGVFKRCFLFLMPLDASFYLKRNFRFLHDKQQWKCLQKFTLSLTGGKDLVFAGTYLMWSTFLFSLGMTFFFMLPRAEEPWMLFFVHSGPESRGPAVLLLLPALCRRQGKVHKTSLSTFSHAIDWSCLQYTVCSPAESSNFPLASGKVWHIDFFFHSLSLNSPQPLE